MNLTHVNATVNYLSWAPPLTQNDNATKALVFLTFAMITAFLFSLLMSKFQRQLREHRANTDSMMHK